jgi:hypothetical protein
MWTVDEPAAILGLALSCPFTISGVAVALPGGDL